MTVTLRDYQQDSKSKVYRSWDDGNRNVVAVLPTGAGKCHGKDTPILMYDGEIKLVQNVREGDLLMGPDSTPRLVVSTTSGIDNLYEVKPVKGDSYIVNSQHVLSLKQTGISKNNNEKGKIVNINIQDYLKSSKYFKHIHKGWRTGVEFTKKELDFDPYMFGVWLGDGTSLAATITTPDVEIYSYLVDFCKKHDMKLRTEHKPDNKAYTYCFSRLNKSDKTSYMRDFLKRYNLMGNKHIPHCFKTASRADRLSLLAGILDTDGSYAHGSYDLIFKSEKLLDDTIFLVRSLGLSAYKSHQIKTCTNNGVSGVYHRCSINGNVDEIPILIERKKAEPRRQIKNNLFTGITVNNIGIGDYYGFEVLGTDRLYLLGDFTVTHNSVIVSDTVLDFQHTGKKCAVIAHRNELVGQMSLHLANVGVQHKLIASHSTVDTITRKHHEEFGRSFLNPSLSTAVVGVDTLISRTEDVGRWAEQIDLWVIDEFHHCIGNDRTEPNKWGKAVKMFTNAIGLGVTATPCRADGQGLGRIADGVADSMIIGPTARWLIEQGHLADYEIVCPASDLKVDSTTVSANGDWSNKTLRKAAKESKIVGDVVQNYVKYASGRKAIVFATDIETAEEMSEKFNKTGVKAVSLNGKSLAAYREQSIDGFAKGDILVLVNVDLFDEGFDVPACDVVIMARPTASLGKYLQSVGRSLRPAPGKVALVIDHVSNVIRHGLPDKQRVWSLDRANKRSKQLIDPDEIPLTVCKECARPYEKFRALCPYCGAMKPLPNPASRTIEMVEGDLVLLDRATLEKMRALTVLEDPAHIAERVARAAGPIAGKGVANRQAEKIEVQTELKNVIAQWAAFERLKGFNDREIHKRFYLTLGFGVLEALSVDKTRSDYETLTVIIRSWYE